MSLTVTVRFAPSPTGFLHIGGVRTALYNYLFARKHGGKFILRIEDTDQERFVPGTETYIVETLAWLGIEPDEGPEQGGEYGPYRQSERISFYRKYILQLIELGYAYYAFDTVEELDAMRVRLKEAKVINPQYNIASREWMRNSLTMPPEEVKEKIQAGIPYVIRLKVPHKEIIRFYDIVRGWLKFESSVLDDKVLIKSDGIPTYHFASVVDDYLMKITHVIRGEEWLPSTPIHVLLYRYLGWEKTMPHFVHLPLLLGPSGSGKLSKRDAERYKFPIFPLSFQSSNKEVFGFREHEYQPEALVNFLALLGWNPGNEQEIFTKKALIEAFSIERIGKSGVKFDIQKAKWFNHYYLQQKSDEELAGYLINILKKNKINIPLPQVIRICQLVKDRIYFPNDLWEQSRFFFQNPESYDEIMLHKVGAEEVCDIIQLFLKALQELSLFEASKIQELLQYVVNMHHLKKGVAMSILRVALTGVRAGPNLVDVIEFIGKEQSVERLIKFLQKKHKINFNKKN